MKVYINKYKDNWISPYIIKEKFFFWKKDYDAYENQPPIWLTKLCEAWLSFANKINRKINYVRVDRWDTWNMDSTLAVIILPMLKQLKATKHGVPNEFVCDINHKQMTFDFDGDKKNNDEIDDAVKVGAEKWDTVIDKMIFSFEHIISEDWQNEFYSGELDHTKEVGKEGWKGTWKCDYEGMKKVEVKIQEGLELFGKYYTHLWD